jgi:TonB family protein
MLKHFLLLSLFVFSTVAVFAQNPAVCDVQLKIYDVETLRGANPVQLENVKIVVKNSAGKTVKPSKTTANLYEKISSGDYEIVATLAGYKTSVEKFSPWCPAESVPPVAASEYVFMWKGDPKEKMDRTSAPRGVFQVSGASNVESGVRSAGNSEPGIVNGKAAKLVIPSYPPAARAVRASGAVNVQVTIDELGYVISASAVSGHPLLRANAEKAARESKFRTTTLGEFPVKVTGIIVYNFTAQ